MIIKPELERTLKSLRLSGICQSLPARHQQALDGAMSPLEFLESLLEDEMNRRKDRLLERRIKAAKLDPLKRLDNFNWSFNPKVSKREICELAAARFISQKENTIFIGAPGTGKTHLAHAIGLNAVLAGHTVLYYQIFDLVDGLTEAAAVGERKAFLSKILNVDLLVIDDLGIRKMAPEKAEELLEVIMKRYEKNSTLMVSNRPIEDWAKILGDAATTSALLDRLMHHANLIAFQGKSYRMDQAALAKHQRAG